MQAKEQGQFGNSIKLQEQEGEKCWLS